MSIPSISKIPPGAVPEIRMLGIASILASGVMGICCYLVAGNSLDLFIGGIFFGSILTPPLAAIAGRSPGAAGCAVSITLGIGCSWALLVWEHVISMSQWAICMLVLSSLLVAMGLGVLLLIRLGCSPMSSSAIVTICILAWLTFPIWMSGALSGSQLHWSVLFHPLFAINGTVPQLGIWTEQQVAYGLTNVGQDVQYQLPRSAWPVIGFQLGLALLIRSVLRERPPAHA